MPLHATYHVIPDEKFHAWVHITAWLKDKPDGPSASVCRRREDECAGISDCLAALYRATQNR